MPRLTLEETLANAKRLYELETDFIRAADELSRKRVPLAGRTREIDWDDYTFLLSPSGAAYYNTATNEARFMGFTLVPTNVPGGTNPAADESRVTEPREWKDEVAEWYETVGTANSPFRKDK